jgi:hypothetical protein
MVGECMKYVTTAFVKTSTVQAFEIDEGNTDFTIEFDDF